MLILSIDTSCDETAAAITGGRKVLSNVIYSQILIHKKWGGVVPSLAKRAHEERIDFVIEETAKKYVKTLSVHDRNFSGTKLPANSAGQTTGSSKFGHFTSKIFSKMDFIAVTYGPGLAVALEVGIKKAKELAKRYKKKLIAVNHLEGHIYSSFMQNSAGNPSIDFKFPYLALVISGGHTEIVVFKNHLTYEVIGETIDDAAGEALDKAAKMLKLGYPGGPVIERLATEVDNKDFFKFPRPMIKSGDLNFSFSGLKTSFYYFLKKNQSVKNEVTKLVSSFQKAVFETIIKKTETAINKTGINRLVVGGGVIANIYLRKMFRHLVKKYNGEVLLPPYKYLTGDNAVMIGVAAYYKAKKDIFVADLNKLDRVPRLRL